jgi:hypothetical protein
MSDSHRPLHLRATPGRAGLQNWNQGIDFIVKFGDIDAEGRQPHGLVDTFVIERRKHMPNRHHALLLALCLLSAGCVVSIPSEPGAANVIMTHKEADVASCTVLGDVQGLTDDNYVRDERREMQNETVELGGDTLLLTRDRDPPTGTAYRCKRPLAKENH